MEIRTVSMKEYSSLRVGGEGRLVSVKNSDELKEVVEYAKAESLRIHSVGGGTNSYYGEDLRDFLFVMFEGKGITVDESEDSTAIVTARAGEDWDDLVAFCVHKGFYGVENLSYIPGTVGAAPVQNIGAYGTELRDVFVSCEVFDIETEETLVMNAEQCMFGYRDSCFKHTKRYILMAVTIRLSKEKGYTLTYTPLDALATVENLSLVDVRNEVIRVRKGKLPEWREHPNCGSFFKNPVILEAQVEALRALFPDIPRIAHQDGYKVPAAWLIEHVACMKGVKSGALRLWDKQPLVIVNNDSATADDVDAFARDITKRIQEKTGITLEQEVNRVG